MKDLYNLCIGNIHLTVACSGSLSLQDLAPRYRPFYSDPPAGADTIRVIIHPEITIARDNLKSRKIFTSGGLWSLFREGDDYLVEVTPAGFGSRLVCMAAFNPGLGEAHIYCDGTFLAGSAWGAGIANPFDYPLDRIFMMYALSKREGIMIHAAAAEIEGRGFVFPGLSGAGKSTLASGLAASGRPFVLTDERVIVRRVNGKIKAFGTPWPGDAGIASSRSVQLSALLFIHHATHNGTAGIPAGQAFEGLLPLSSIPWYDPETMTDVLSFCEGLTSEIPAYDLHCTPGSDVVNFLEEFARGFE